MLLVMFVDNTQYRQPMMTRSIYCVRLPVGRVALLFMTISFIIAVRLPPTDYSCISHCPPPTVSIPRRAQHWPPGQVTLHPSGKVPHGFRQFSYTSDAVAPSVAASLVALLLSTAIGFCISIASASLASS